jgi:hypothetical protein
LEILRKEIEKVVKNYEYSLSDFCCDDMRDFFNHDKVHLISYKGCISVALEDDGMTTDFNFDYCPFCGEKIVIVDK